MIYKIVGNGLVKILTTEYQFKEYLNCIVLEHHSWTVYTCDPDWHEVIDKNAVKWILVFVLFTELSQVLKEVLTMNKHDINYCFVDTKTGNYFDVCLVSCFKQCDLDIAVYWEGWTKEYIDKQSDPDAVFDLSVEGAKELIKILQDFIVNQKN